MGARGRGLAAALIAACMLGATAARATPITHAAAAPSVAGEALVRFDASTPRAIRDAIERRTGVRALRAIPAIGYDLVAGDVAAIAALGKVAHVEPDYTGRVALSPSDSCTTDCTGLPGQWNLQRINAPFGWDVVPGRTFTSADKVAPVTIAVLDTHIDPTNPDWINAGGTSPDSSQGGQLDLADAHDFVDASHWTGSAAYHGTFVAGLAAGAAGNGRDVAGVAYLARVMPLTVVDGGGNTDAATLAQGIVYAWQHGARVINLSLGITGDSGAVHDAIRTVTTGNATYPPSLVVAAAGNNTGNAPFYPGSYPESMSVGGTDAEDGHASCANYNSNISVSAPADRLFGLNTMPNETVQAPCGTSAATPQVSGLAALLFAQDPSRAPAQVRRIIEATADDLGTTGRDDYFGYGRINVERALRYGASCSVTGVVAPVAAPNGSSTISAVATCANGVRSAQVVVGRPDATPIAMQPGDGAWGGTTERIWATVPAGAAGLHQIWVRASDGTPGAAAAAVLVADGRAPTISNAHASNGVRATQPIVVTFNGVDDHSTTLDYAVQFRSQATNQVLYTSPAQHVRAGAESYSWTPPLTAPAGPFDVKLAVVDAYGNVGSVEVGSVVT